MPEYKRTPERIAELAKLERTAGFPPGPNHAMLPPTWLPYMEAKYAEEDRLIAEFGSLPKFDWRFWDESGTEMGTRMVTGVSTLIEAVQRVTDYWRRAKYQVVGSLHALRSDGKRFD